MQRLFYALASIFIVDRLGLVHSWAFWTIATMYFIGIAAFRAWAGIMASKTPK